VSARRLGVSAALVDGALLPGDVAVADGLVTDVGLPAARGGRIASPGLVDLQVNGFAGIDLMGADADEVRAVGRALAGYGVTAWLPTLITAPPADTAAALKVLATVVPTAPGRWDDDGAEPLGVHLEGPYVSPHRLGTHPPQHRRDPDPAEMAGWRGRGPVVAVTLAPELPGALAMVAALAADGVLVSVGHTDATAEQAHAGFDAGARTVTHLFNAMSGLHHRAPGVPGAALARRDVVVQLIVDGHHLAPDVVRAAWSASAGRVVLVTDATSAAAHPEGEAEGGLDLAGVAVQVRDGAVRNDDGTLAGSALTLDRAVRNACALGIDVAAALTAATRTPADLVGRRDLGRLEPGGRADLVVLDDALDVCDTLLAGRVQP
jgi:N-acetylglucosamine-6-phosphate deacetylase